MNRKVYLLSEFGEVYLGTVREVVTGNGDGDDTGVGIAVQDALSDIVNELAFGDGDRDHARLTIRLR